MNSRCSSSCRIPPPSGAISGKCRFHCPSLGKAPFISSKSSPCVARPAGAQTRHHAPTRLGEDSRGDRPTFAPRFSKLSLAPDILLDLFEQDVPAAIQRAAEADEDGQGRSELGGFELLEIPG